MSAKKKISLAVFSLIAIAILIFWYVGSNYRAERRAEQQKRYAELLHKEAKNEILISQALTRSGDNLEDFNPNDLPKRLTNKDLKIVTVSSSTLQAYTQAMLNVLRPFGAERKNEVETMLQALDRQSETEAQKILPNKELYDGAIASLLTAKVPSSVTISHLKMLNSLRDMSYLSSNMINALRNPVLALQSAEIFRQRQIIFYTSINEINSYLGRQGVKLNESDKVDLYFNLK